MRAKYLIIYFAAGIAFIAVSAWVFFTNGNNAKALRAKYKLGGLLLTCTAMLSVASCGQIPGLGVTCYDTEVTCYDPYVEEHDIVTFENLKAVFHEDPPKIAPGDTIFVKIDMPSYEHYALVVSEKSEENTLLQREELSLTEDGSHFEVPLSEDITFKGVAFIDILGILKDDEGSHDSPSLGRVSVTII